jgi:tripartite-type tricarboxylate transporter receptor subunit TctC
VIARRALLVTGLASPALAQPARPIRLVVPFLPGGAVDAWARLLAEALGPRLGQIIVIENRAGAGGMLGAEAVARATPDGQTLLFTVDALVQTPVTLRRFPYDPLRDFTPIGRLGTAAVTFTIGPAVPAEVHSLGDFVTWGRGRSLNFANSGEGGSAHALALHLAREAGLDVTHIPYRGEPAMVSDMLAGRFHGAFVTTITFGELMRSGRVRPLASSGQTRVPSLAERVPLVSEAGFLRDFRYRGFAGLFAPAGLEAPVLSRLSAAFAEAAQDRELQNRLLVTDFIQGYQGPDEFAASVAQALADWQRITTALDLARVQD